MRKAIVLKELPKRQTCLDIRSARFVLDAHGRAGGNRSPCQLILRVKFAQVSARQRIVSALALCQLQTASRKCCDEGNIGMREFMLDLLKELPKSS